MYEKAHSSFISLEGQFISSILSKFRNEEEFVLACDVDVAVEEEEGGDVEEEEDVV